MGNLRVVALLSAAQKPLVAVDASPPRATPIAAGPTPIRTEDSQSAPATYAAR